jgi:hypothetical protein
MTPGRFRPRLEMLEGRDTPGMLTLTYAAATRTLTVAGNSAANQVSIDGANGSGGLVISATGDSILAPNGVVVASPYLFSSRVDNLTVNLRGGDDALTLGAAFPIELAGSVVVGGGSGNNTLSTLAVSIDGNLTVTNGVGTDLTQMILLDIGGALSVANGAGGSTTEIKLLHMHHMFTRRVSVTNGAGDDATTLTDLMVAGQVVVANGGGGSRTVINRDMPGQWRIGGNVTVTNGVGTDETEISDTNVNGSVAIQNGSGGASGNAGHTWISNPGGPGRAIIGGDVSVSYLDGDVTAKPDELLDVQVLGSVTFNHGLGSSETILAGDQTSLPMIVRGSLTLTGSGRTIVRDNGPSGSFGLVVGGDYRVTAGSGDDEVHLDRGDIGGRTVLALGGGANLVSVDDTLFLGPVTITTGAGADTISVDTKAGTVAPTTFERPVLISLGAGNDIFSTGGSDDNMQHLVIFAPIVVHHGAGTDQFTHFGTDETPLGWWIDYQV